MDLPRTSAFRAVLASVLALLVSALTSLAVGVSPFDAMSSLVGGFLGSTYNVGVWANNAAPLILLGLSFAVALRNRIINIGLEGQFLIGALCSTMIATTVSAPALLHIPASLLAGALGGAAWALLPALLKAWRGVNELVTTLMMNFVAISIISYLVTGPLRADVQIPESEPVRASAQLPVILPGSRMSAGILVALGVALVVWVLMAHTKWGFRMRSAGMNPEAAHFAGMKVRRLGLQTFLLSGALSGVAGSVVLLGDQFRLKEGLIDTWYIGIVIAIIGGATALGCVIAGIGFGALEAGAFQVQLGLGVPASIVIVMQGLALLMYTLLSQARLPRLLALIGSGSSRDAEKDSSGPRPPDAGPEPPHPPPGHDEPTPAAEMKAG